MEKQDDYAEDAFVKAFELWETTFRAHPEQFMTADEIAAAAVLPLSAQRAVYFKALLRDIVG